MKSASVGLYVTHSFPPAVIVHGMAHACAAVSSGLPVTLLSARGAALAGGCGWWQALVRKAREAAPNTPLQDILDCADAPGIAMAALRMRQGVLRLDGTVPAFSAVAKAAAAQGAVLLSAAPPALDLAGRGNLSRITQHLRNAAQQLVTDAARDSTESLR